MAQHCLRYLPYPGSTLSNFTHFRGALVYFTYTRVLCPSMVPIGYRDIRVPKRGGPSVYCTHWLGTFVYCTYKGGGFPRILYHQVYLKVMGGVLEGGRDGEGYTLSSGAPAAQSCPFEGGRRLFLGGDLPLHGAAR